MNEQEKFDTTIRILESLNDVPSPDPLRQASARRAFLDHAARLRSDRAHNQGGFLPRSFRLAAGGLGAFVLTLGMLTGVVYAADGARPGDLLYPIDRVSEDIRLSLNPDPTATLHLVLDFAEERLVESEQLASKGDLENMAVALEAYSQTIGNIAQNADSQGIDQEVQAALIETFLAAHEERLQAIHDKIPAYAYPSLEKAIEAVRMAQEKNKPNKNPPNNPGPAGNGPGQGQSNSSSEPKEKKDMKPGGPPEGNPGHGPPENTPGHGPPESLPGPPEGNPGGPPSEIPGNGPPDSAPSQQGGNSTHPEESNSNQSQPDSVTDPNEEKPGGPPENPGPPT